MQGEWDGSEVGVKMVPPGGVMGHFGVHWCLFVGTIFRKFHIVGHDGIHEK